MSFYYYSDTEGDAAQLEQEELEKRIEDTAEKMWKRCSKELKYGEEVAGKYEVGFEYVGEMISWIAHAKLHPQNTELSMMRLIEILEPEFTRAAGIIEGV